MNNEKPKCPYCGAIMFPTARQSDGKFRVAWVCCCCNSRSPDAVVDWDESLDEALNGIKTKLDSGGQG
jgi:hypothetical protein